MESAAGRILSLFVFTGMFLVSPPTGVKKVGQSVADYYDFHSCDFKYMQNLKMYCSIVVLHIDDVYRYDMYA